jgi:hypothetical protein
MAEQPNPQRARPIVPSGESAFMSILAAALFLYVGFGLSPVYIGNAIRDGAIAAFFWMARIVGVGLVAVAALAFVNRTLSSLLNLVMGAIATVGCTGAGVILLAYGEVWNAVLLILFGAVNGHATRNAWQSWNASRRASAGEPPG